jgi:hypothetical protein
MYIGYLPSLFVESGVGHQTQEKKNNNHAFISCSVSLSNLSMTSKTLVLGAFFLRAGCLFLSPTLSYFRPGGQVHLDWLFVAVVNRLQIPGSRFSFLAIRNGVSQSMQPVMESAWLCLTPYFKMVSALRMEFSSVIRQGLSTYDEFLVYFREQLLYALKVKHSNQCCTMVNIWQPSVNFSRFHGYES